MNNNENVAKKSKETADRLFIVHIYAVVRAFKLPRKARTGEWFAEMSLVDDTSKEPFAFRMFRKCRNDLPKISSMGDVIRLHRAVLQVRSRNIRRFFFPRYSLSFSNFAFVVGWLDRGSMDLINW